MVINLDHIRLARESPAMEGWVIQGALLSGMSGEYCACASDDICADERVMLAELAATLYNWPNRNIVFEKAIHAVALELLAMASELTDGDALAG